MNNDDSDEDCGAHCQSNAMFFIELILLFNTFAERRFHDRLVSMATK